MNIEAKTLKLARTKYADNMPVQKLVERIDQIKSQIKSNHEAHLRFDEFAGFLKGLNGENGFYATIHGVREANIMYPVQVYGEQRAYTELFGVLVSILSALGEEIEY